MSVPEPEAKSVAYPSWTIAATMLASSLAFIDGSVTNVALPAIGKDLGGNAANLPWIINAYLLPLSALLLIGGAAGDHFGRRRMLIAGIVLFALASVGCALAPDLAMLFASRALQGLGAAILMPNSLGILGSSFEGEGARTSRGHLGGGRRHRQRDRATIGRMAGRCRRLASDLLSQPARRHRRDPCCVALRHRKRCGGAAARLAGRSPRHRGARHPDVGSDPLVQPPYRIRRNMGRPGQRHRAASSSSCGTSGGAANAR